MCGRYAIDCEEENIELKDIIEEINRRYAGKAALAQLKTGEIFPTDVVPVLTPENGKTRPVLMRWGFPRWDSKGVVINARAETAMKKNFFRPSLLSRRCLLPSTGFYEWGRKKTPPATLFNFLETSGDAASALSPEEKKGKYLLRIPGIPMLYMAGFYNLSPEEAEDLPFFVILTTTANEWVAPLHDRMPLILNGPDARDWLGETNAALNVLSRPCITQLSAKLQ